MALAFPVDEAEPNDSTNQAQSIDTYFSLDNDPSIVSSGTVPHATINGSEEGNRDYYAFTVNQAGVNTTGIFDVDGAMPAFDSYLWLYDTNGNLLREDDDNDLADPGSEHRYDSYLEYNFPSAGTYYIAVGNRSSSSGSSSGVYGLHVSIQGAVTSDTPPPDTTPPNTVLVQKPDTLSDEASPSIEFRSSEGNSTFECKIDGGAFQSCASPKRYFLLSEGEHTFQVRAKDASGNVEQTPAQHTWTVDSKNPKVTFTERPGTATGPDEYDEWVTSDRSPTWAWTVEDLHLDSEQVSCDLDEGAPDYRDILYIEPCASPFTFEADLPDGDYSFDVEAYDGAGNYGDAYNEFEVDTVAPQFVSGAPTGRRVSPYADVVVTFDDNVHNSKQFVNIYRGASSSPLAVYRYAYGNKKIEISPKNSLRRDTRYTVKVTTGVTDGANSLEAPKTWSFKTR